MNIIEALQQYAQTRRDEAQRQRIAQMNAQMAEREAQAGMPGWERQARAVNGSLLNAIRNYKMYQDVPQNAPMSAAPQPAQAPASAPAAPNTYGTIMDPMRRAGPDAPYEPADSPVPQSDAAREILRRIFGQ